MLCFTFSWNFSRTPLSKNSHYFSRRHHKITTQVAGFIMMASFSVRKCYNSSSTLWIRILSWNSFGKREENDTLKNKQFPIDDVNPRLSVLPTLCIFTLKKISWNQFTLALVNDFTEIFVKKLFILKALYSWQHWRR